MSRSQGLRGCSLTKRDWGVGHALADKGGRTVAHGAPLRVTHGESARDVTGPRESRFANLFVIAADRRMDNSPHPIGGSFEYQDRAAPLDWALGACLSNLG